MRTKQQERARFGWMTTREFADAIGVGTEQVLGFIADGWFRTEGNPPECLNVARPGAKRPEYRIHPDALKRFYREHAA